ncbi:putative CBS domain-containing protein [Dioscorea sansibarensis]
MAQETQEKIPSCDSYFEAIQSRKKLPFPLQQALTSAFSQIPVSSFPDVPSGKVVEIEADTSIIDAVKVLSENKIMAAPVRNSGARNELDWKQRYLGVIDYSAVILWVMENAELAAVALSAGTATAAGVGLGAVGAMGAVALGATGPAAVAGLTAAAVTVAMAGGFAAKKGMGRDAPSAADHLGEDFYKILQNEEPFKSTTVKSIIESYRWSPFLPVSADTSMLTVLLLLSKYRLRNVPVIEMGKPGIRNFITQSAVVRGLQQCKGRDCFDTIASQPLSDLGLPFMPYNEFSMFTAFYSISLRNTKICGFYQVFTAKSNELILEAFKRMKDNRIGGLPVTKESSRKITGSVSIRDIQHLLLMPELFSNFRYS